MPTDFQPKFGGAAGEFDRYRPDYPAALYERIFGRIPPPRRRCAMDLGAGTGIVTAHLVGVFAQVIAVEPDPGMAAKIAESLPGVRIYGATAEDCTHLAESVDLVTIANALHWMEAPRVLANVRGWLRSGGLLAVFDRPLPKATPPVDEIVLSELRGPWQPHSDPRLKRNLDGPRQVRAAGGFRVVEETKFTNVVPMTPSEYTGFWRSTSYGSAYARTLPDPTAYWRGLESRFEGANSAATIPVDLSPTLILAQKS